MDDNGFLGSLKSQKDRSGEAGESFVDSTNEVVSTTEYQTVEVDLGEMT